MTPLLTVQIRSNSNISGCDQSCSLQLSVIVLCGSDPMPSSSYCVHAIDTGWDSVNRVAGQCLSEETNKGHSTCNDTITNQLARDRDPWRLSVILGTRGTHYYL